MDIQKVAEEYVMTKARVVTLPNGEDDCEELDKAFQAGANYQRNAVWHDVSKKIPTNFGTDVIVLCKNRNKEGGIWQADIIQCWEGEWEPRTNWEDPVKWAYLSDILPTKKKS